MEQFKFNSLKSSGNKKSEWLELLQIFKLWQVIFHQLNNKIWFYFGFINKSRHYYVIVTINLPIEPQILILKVILSMLFRGHHFFCFSGHSTKNWRTVNSNLRNKGLQYLNFYNKTKYVNFRKPRNALKG